jgi:hypothetical protein
VRVRSSCSSETLRGRSNPGLRIARIYGKISDVRATTIVTMATLLTAPAAADPSPRERAAIVAIDLGPGTPGYLGPMAASHIEAGLTAAGYEVVRVGTQLPGELATCRDGACVRRIGEVLGVRSLVLARIDGEGENTLLTLRLHDGRTGERVAEVHEVCDLCGQAELSGRLRLAAQALRPRSLEVRAARDPQPAAGPAPAPTPADRTAPGPGARPRASRSSMPGILVGAAGAAAIGGGLYLVAIHGRGTCARGDGPVYPAPGAVIRYNDFGGFECRDVYETRTLGIASAGVGAVALAAGVALFVRARQGGRMVEVLPGPGGATIGVSGSW